MTRNEEFTEDTLDYISKLALLELTEDEKESLTKQLREIIEFFNKLNELNTDDIEPTTHPIEGLKNVFREDIPWKSLSNEEALRNAEHTQDGYFKAPRILKKS